jgi:CRISPR-associated protein Cmr4
MIGYYKIDAYILRCLTNLHAGSGGETNGIVDNTIQRDAATNYPTIHATSLKGALREDFEMLKDIKGKALEAIFGNDPKPGATQAQGEVRFFPAHLLCLPVRSNIRPFFRAVSIDILLKLQSDLTVFGINNTALDDAIDNLIFNIADKTTPQYLDDLGDKTVILEDEKAAFLSLDATHKTALEQVFGTHIAVYPDGEAFNRLSKNMPVQARNQLEKGESKNLWYEEYVPRETRFYAFTAQPKTFNFALSGTYQIGANATVGFGYTEFTLFPQSEKKV